MSSSGDIPVQQGHYHKSTHRKNIYKHLFEDCFHLDTIDRCYCDDQPKSVCQTCIDIRERECSRESADIHTDPGPPAPRLNQDGGQH